MNTIPDFFAIIDTLCSTRLKDFTITGVLITGSYAKGLQHPGSDLDIIIITSNRDSRRTRGNVVIDDILVEYYVNPYNQVIKYLSIDKRHNNPMIYIALLEGNILFEKYSVLTKLREKARQYSDMPYPALSPEQVEFGKYVIADTRSKMASLYKKKVPSFAYSYYLNLRSMYEFYAKYLRQPILKDYMLEDYFGKNARFGEVIGTFPDSAFSKLFAAALVVSSDDERIRLYTQLAERILQRTGGFTLDGWAFTLSVDYTNKMDTRTRIF